MFDSSLIKAVLMTAMIDFQETMLIFFTIFHFFAMSSVCSNPIMLVAITNIIQICSGRNSIKVNQEKTPFHFFQRKNKNIKKTQ